ncbi:MAG: PfkB family carbohydrate kinase, partial [Anaerolineae bacterium]
MKRYDVLTIGETMIRLSPPDHQRLEQATELEMRIGGAESNVAVGLARLGLRVAWVSRLVDNPLGRRIAYELRRHGVDTSHVVWTDQGRVATYFIEFGSRPRPTTILYDRCDSAMSHMGVGDIDWSLIGQSRLIHLTGITAALSPSCYDLVREAIHVAKGTAVEVSFDLNYRAKLWAPSEAKAKLDPICREVDILSASREDLTTIFGLKGSAEELLDRVQEKYARKLVIITLGAKGAICGDKAPINRDKA